MIVQIDYHMCACIYGIVTYSTLCKYQARPVYGIVVVHELMLHAMRSCGVLVTECRERHFSNDLSSGVGVRWISQQGSHTQAGD